MNSKRPRYSVLVMLSAVVLLASCAIEVNTVFNPRADFKAYKTYCWMEGCNVLPAATGTAKDTALNGQLRRNLETELIRKGFVRTNENPDVLIALKVAVKDEQAIIYRREDDLPMLWPADAGVNVMSFAKGTVVVAMADRKSGTLVWESKALRYMESESDLKPDDLRRLVRRLLMEYPPDTETPRKRTNAIY